MHPISLREQVFALRKNGFSYTYISSKTGLSKGTLSGWLTDVPYTPNKETVASFGKARAATSARRAQLRQDSIREIRKIAESDIGKISRRDLFMFGLALYLGEGCKSNSQVRMVNSDPRIIQAMVVWIIRGSEFTIRT